MLQLDAPPVSFCKWDGDQCVTVQSVDPSRFPLSAGVEVVRWFTAQPNAPITVGPVVRVRDSKLDQDSPVVEFTLADWRAFHKLLPEWEAAADGEYKLGPLSFTEGEWRQFRRGVLRGFFDVLSSRVQRFERTLVDA